MATAQDYKAKVDIYFLTTLGRRATDTEMTQWSQALTDNNGNVWKSGMAASLNGTELANLMDGKSSSDIVKSMYANISMGDVPTDPFIEYYATKLDSGLIKLKGLANAMINDLAIMPKSDGTIGQPPNWSINTSDYLKPQQVDNLQKVAFGTIDIQQYQGGMVGYDLVGTNGMPNLNLAVLPVNVFLDMENLQIPNFNGQATINGFGADDMLEIFTARTTNILFDSIEGTADVKVGVVGELGQRVLIDLIGVNPTMANISSKDDYNAFAVGDILFTA